MPKSNDNENLSLPSNAWQYSLMRLLFTVLQGLFWLFAGGLAWTIGASAGWVCGAEDGVPIGGAVGLAVAMALILGFSNSRDRQLDTMLSVTFATLGGAGVCGLIGYLLFGSNYAVVGGFLIGFVAGCASFLMRQFLPIADARQRALAGAACGAVIGSVGWRIGGLAGWSVAGAVGLCLMRLVTESLRTSPIVVVDRDEKPIAELSFAERWVWVARDTIRWTQRGALAGLGSAALAQWAVRRAPELDLRSANKWLVDAEPALQAAFHAMWLPAVVLLCLIVRFMMAAIGWKPLRKLDDSGKEDQPGDAEDPPEDST